MAINKRAASGHELTKKQKEKYDIWLASNVQRLVFNKKRRCYVSESRQITKDCIVLQLELSETPADLLLSSGSSDKKFQLVLLKHDAIGSTSKLPDVLDQPVSEEILLIAAAEQTKEDEQDQQEDLGEDQVHELEDEKFAAEYPNAGHDDESHTFMVLADSDDEDEWHSRNPRNTDYKDENLSSSRRLGSSGETQSYRNASTRQRMFHRMPPDIKAMARILSGIKDHHVLCLGR